MALGDKIRNYGTNSYFVWGRQTDWTGRATTAIQKVYELVSSEIRPQYETYQVERNKGHAGPTKAIQGAIGVRGPVVLNLDETHLGELFQWITGDRTPTTTAISGGDVVAAGTEVTVGTPVKPADANQPKALVAAPVEIGQLKFTLTGASGAGSILIVGTDQLDRDIEESIAFSSPGTHTSTKYYREVKAMTLKGTEEETPGTSITWRVECVPGAYKHELSLQKAIPPFMSMEMVYGEDIITHVGLVPNNTTINFGNIIQMSVDVLGRRSYIGQNLTGGTDKTALTGFDRPKGNVMADIGTILDVDGELFYCSSIDFGLNQNLDFAETKYGARTAYEREPVRNGNRELTCGFTIDYNQEKGFDKRSFGEDLAVKLTYGTTPLGGQHTSIEFHMPQCAFAEAAVPGIPDGGPIYQPMSLLPYATQAGNELTVTVRNSEAKAAFI